MDTYRILLTPSAICRRLALVAAAFVAVNAAMQSYRLIAHREYVPGLALVSLDGEHNLPALFSTLLLLFAALLLALIARLARGQKAPDASKWTLLAVGFLFMSLDEAMALHEKLIDPLRGLLASQHLGIFYYAWVIPAIALVVALGLYFLPFMLRLPRRTAVAFVIAAAFYLGGALGVELIEGWWKEDHSYIDPVYHLLVTLEESLEMGGAILFIRALLGYIAGTRAEVRLSFVSGTAVETDTMAAPTQRSSAQQLAAGSLLARSSGD